MAEDYGYGYGRYPDDYDDEYVYNEAGYDHADEADHDDYGYEEDTQGLTDEAVDDAHLLNGAMSEPVSYVPEDPTEAVESASYERIGRFKNSWKGRARARREDRWMPPDLRGYGPHVFWPVEDQEEAGQLARRMPMDLPEIEAAIRRQVRMQPLVSCQEVARNLQLEVAVVEEAAKSLQRQGKLNSVDFGCRMPRTARYWEERESIDFSDLDWIDRDALSWHRDDAIGSLLKYDMPKVESISQVAVRYAMGGWELKGLAWVEEEAVQAVGLYQWRKWDFVKGLVYFVWLPLWASEREVKEQLDALPAAVGRITGPGLAGHVVLIGPDRWAVSRALPMAVDCLKARHVKPANIAAWTYSDGWQAASGASMLDGAARPFRPALSAAPVDRFRWPLSLRRLGREKLETVIKNCPWTRRDACTLYTYFMIACEYTGGSIAHFAALRGKSDRDRLAWKRNIELLELGLLREVGIAGVAKLPVRERAELLSERGQGRMRYRVSLSPKIEKMLADLAKILARGQSGKLTEEDAKKVEELEEKLGGLPKLANLAVEQSSESRKKKPCATVNGAYRLMLNHGHLSLREIVRRSGLASLADRLGVRRLHDDILLDLLGSFRLMGCEVVPTSRAITFTLQGREIKSDAVVYCSSPAGTGHHRLELERSHLGPQEIRARLEKYALVYISYPLLVVCRTNRGAENFDRIGRELGVSVVATSLARLRKFGVTGLAWIHQGQEVYVTAVPCPPAPADH